MEMSVDGHAFHAQFPKGRASGTIHISPSGITFSNDKASVSFPVADTRVSLGGASDRLVFFDHASQPGWRLYTADRSVLNNPHLHMDRAVSGQLSRARRLRILNWSVFSTVAAAILLVPLLIIFSMDTLTGWIAPQLPVEWEEQLGKTVYGQYQVSNDIIDNDEATAALKALTDPLFEAVGSDRYTFRIVVSDDPNLNAFALPGGYIVLNSGLVLEAESANEVLGVLGHEIAHVTGQHGVRQVMGQAGLYLTIQALLGDVTGLMATVANAAPLLLSQSYSRGFEAEADEQGVAYLAAGRVDPNGLVSFFERILAEEAKMRAKLKDKVDENTEGEGEDVMSALESVQALLSTHPATEERISALKRRIGDVEGPYEDYQAAFERLKRAVAAEVEHDDLRRENAAQSGNP